MFSFKKMPNVFQSGYIISLASYSNVWKVFYLHSQYRSVLSLFCFNLYFRYYNRYVVVSQCPNFFDDQCCWKTYHVLISHLYVLFNKTSSCFLTIFYFGLFDFCFLEFLYILDICGFYCHIYGLEIFSISLHLLL